jgi:hypothetical protein
MKTSTKIALILLFMQLSWLSFSPEAKANDTLKIPEKAIILSLSYEGNFIIYTMVDLNNSEMVIVTYVYTGYTELKLKNVFWTGMTIDLEKQSKISIDNQSKKE